MSEYQSYEQTPTIIVCLDNTKASKVTLRYACYKAKRTGFAVQILTVIEASYKGLLFASRKMGNERRVEIEKHLKKIIGEIGNETGITPSISVREGDIVEEITKEIVATPTCTMLILGKAYGSLSDNTVLPRLSTKIGTKIKVPVAIVPSNLSDEYLQNLV